MGFNETKNIYITSWNNIAFRVKESAKKIVLPKFLWIYFNRSEWDRQTNFLAWGSSTIVFAWNDFLNIKIELPPLTEQQKIVDTYNAISKRIRIKQKINENLEKTAQAIYLDVVKECKQDDLIHGTIQQLGEFVRGKNITSNEMKEGKYEVISAGLLPSGTHSEYNVKGPSITISGSGVNAGYISLHLNDIWAADCSYNNSSRNIFSLYVIIKLQQSRIFELQKGTAQPHVFPKEINPFEIDYPCLKILNELEYKFRSIYKKIFINNKELNELEKLKQLVVSQISKR